MKWDLSKVLKNPEIAIQQQFGAEGDTDAARQLATARREAKKAELVAEFCQVWRGLGGPALTEEYIFHPVRRWRADFAHLDTRVLVEIDGGVWAGGRHTRGGGFIEDCAKLNAAAVLGWTVFRLATGMMTVDNVQPIIDHINQRIAK